MAIRGGRKATVEEKDSRALGSQRPCLPLRGKKGTRPCPQSFSSHRVPTAVSLIYHCVSKARINVWHVADAREILTIGNDSDNITTTEYDWLKAYYVPGTLRLLSQLIQKLYW